MNIKISKHAHSCAACGNDFQHEQMLTSIVKVAEGILQREDFCSDCWRAEQKKDAYSMWTMEFHDPKVEDQQPAEVFSPLRQLFYEAAESNSRVEMAKAFLAAGLLRRQKVFRLIKESDESDGEVRITLYTDRIGNRLIEVPDPQFSYAEMEKGRILLIARLQELEAAVAAANAPESAAPISAQPAEPMASADSEDDQTGNEVAEELDAEDGIKEDGGTDGDADVEDEEDEYDDDDDDDEDDEDEDEYDDDDDEDDDDEDEEDEYDDEDDDDEDEEDDEGDDDDEDDESEEKLDEIDNESEADHEMPVSAPYSAASACHASKTLYGQEVHHAQA